MREGNTPGLGVPSGLIRSRLPEVRRSPGGGDRRHRECGAGRLRLLIWLVVLLCFVYGAVQALPSFINEYEFEDALKETARFASVNRTPPEQIREALLKVANEDAIPIRPQDIVVTSVGGNVKIDAEYSVTVDLSVYQWTLNFHPSATNFSL
jgi:hypothetical protein